MIFFCRDQLLIDTNVVIVGRMWIREIYSLTVPLYCMADNVNNGVPFYYYFQAGNLSVCMNVALSVKHLCPMISDACSVNWFGVCHSSVLFKYCHYHFLIVHGW